MRIGDLPIHGPRGLSVAAGRSEQPSDRPAVASLGLSARSSARLSNRPLFSGLGLVVQGVDVALLEYTLGNKDRVQYAWEPGVGDAVKDRLDDLAGGQADVQRSIDMDLQLRLRTAERRKG
jgi:hypothetical protein